MIMPALLAAWEATGVEIHWPRGVEILPSIIEARARPMTRPAGSVGHVVTAWNPGARVLPDRENASRHAALREVVAAAGLAWVSATGRARDGSWHEAGIFLPVRGSLADGRRVAVALGRRFGQLGVYEIDEGRLRAIACGDGSVLAPLPATAGVLPPG